MSKYIKHSEDDSLTHYGVKGMKWKKRKSTYDYDIRADNMKIHRSGASAEYVKERAFNSKSNVYPKEMVSASKLKPYQSPAQKAKKKVLKKANKTLKSSRKAISKGYKKLRKKFK